MSEFHALLNQQKTYFNQQYTQSYEFRITQLKRLKSTIEQYERRILDALKQDLNKSAAEAYMTEIAPVLAEIHYFQKRLKRLMRPTAVRTPLAHFKASSYRLSQPYGSVLILSPWNYPFQLAFIPLIGAIAAGNCVVIKPSEYASATANVTAQLLQTCFDDAYVSVQLGGVNVAQALLSQPFDYLFFTGSSQVGKQVMAKAAEQLIPLTLELGGKSPCIVDKHANIALSARRIMWGKLLNAGQTCVATDYVYVHESVKAEFVQGCIHAIERFFGQQPLNHADYPKIIHSSHFERLCALLDNSTILYGGERQPQTCQIAPTLVDCDDWQQPCMQKEIFGPILPILTYTDLNEVITQIRQHDKPLACYIFSEEQRVIEQIQQELPFGCGCINDTLIQVSNPHLGFGGIGASGMGRYHGQASFDTFSHQKTMMRKSTYFDLALRYPPFRYKFWLLKCILRWIG